MGKPRYRGFGLFRAVTKWLRGSPDIGAFWPPGKRYLFTGEAPISGLLAFNQREVELCTVNCALCGAWPDGTREEGRGGVCIDDAWERLLSNQVSMIPLR